MILLLFINDFLPFIACLHLMDLEISKSDTRMKWQAIFRMPFTVCNVGFSFRVYLPLLLSYSDVILFSLGDSDPFFKTICTYFSIEKSSGSETSKAPTQEPVIFKVGF